jgi:molecular chaperone GrpE
VALGEAFDPSLHHSIHNTPTENKDEDHKISEVVQKGYKLAGRILRPARVNVFEFGHGSENNH